MNMTPTNLPHIDISQLLNPCYSSLDHDLRRSANAMTPHVIISTLVGLYIDVMICILHPLVILRIVQLVLGRTK